jgi:hypothetical protein
MASDDIRTMFENKYIGAWSLAAGDQHVTISKVQASVVEGEGGRQDKAPLIWFEESRKPMVCNKTNLKTIASIVGSFRAKDWIGKRITLYATTCKGAKGGQVACVRVRPTAPGSQQRSGPMPDVPVDPDMRKNQQEQAGEREPGED